MIYFFDSAGNSFRCVPERICQGSSEANSLTLIAPFDDSAQLAVSFCLPTGESTPRYYMQFIGPMGGAITAEGGKLYGWRTLLPALVTARYGLVAAQFFRVGTQGDILATEKVLFTVEQGVAPDLSQVSDEESYLQILSVISQLHTDVKNAAYAARALYGWNATYHYSVNEIVYCPEAYERGSFVRSLVTENTNPPYNAQGGLNSQYWEEVCRFDDAFEQAALAEQAKISAQQSAAAASSSAAAAATAEESAANSAASAAADKIVCAESAESAENSAKAAQEAMEKAQQIVGGDFAQQADLEKIIDGTTKVGAAVRADSAATATNATNAVNAQTAVKATQDASGNVLTNTYATKSELAAKQDKLSADIVIGTTQTSLSAGKKYVGCTISNVTVSAAGNYFLVNCSGSITVSGTSAKIYCTDCSELTVNGITANNWFNVFVDGVANYQGMTRFLNGVQVLKNSLYGNSNAPSEKTVSFQIAFASNDYTLAIAPNIPDTDYKFYKAMPAVEHISASQFKLKFVSFDGNEQVSPAVDYIAIGKWK